MFTCNLLKSDKSVVKTNILSQLKAGLCNAKVKHKLRGEKPHVIDLEKNELKKIVLFTFFYKQNGYLSGTFGQLYCMMTKSGCHIMQNATCLIIPFGKEQLRNEL